MAFGLQDLERDVQRFKVDIENAKAQYINEYAECLNIATDFENIEQKYDFLQEEVELITKVFPEERENNLTATASVLFISSGVLELAVGAGFYRQEGLCCIDALKLLIHKGSQYYLTMRHPPDFRDFWDNRSALLIDVSYS